MRKICKYSISRQSCLHLGGFAALGVHFAYQSMSSCNIKIIDAQYTFRFTYVG